ncbi:antirestriction protein [Streptomyces sp. WZ.A104]|uniref:antirestriction protein ArdA n=1 Tax=Streptomyces sp. WZ.A104 TaxID=2023771 RepID=UPI000BBB8652|nr:antirestriction protein ArdA [Streptomyces sp. WZ.A104]PCG86377.1 antirestriction protein [Streptomyces sp. WZ.A104]
MSTTLSTGIQPSVWIGCLACYNAGRLVGDWYDADTADLVTPEDLHGRETNHEELWVMDHEGFCGVLEGECSPSEAAELAEVLADLSEDEAAPFSAWVEVYGEQSERAHWVERFREEFRGFHKNEGHFAQEWAEDTSQPEDQARMQVWPFNAIDWDYAAQELFSGGFHSEDAPGGVYVFCPR